MFQEPKILPWLAKKAGVPFPEAREIWRDVASEADAQGTEGADVAGRIVRELRRKLREKGRQYRRVGNRENAGQADWMFPTSYMQTWAECQARIFLNLWLAWARATRPA